MTREKAYEILDKHPLCNECDSSFPYNCDECGEAFLTAFDALKQPEIVRCKDCKWWDKKNGSNYGYCNACKHGYSSPHWEIGIYRTYDGEWFCADGERKDGEKEG